MKKSLVLIISIVFCSYSFSQTSTGKLTGLKDSWGESFTYTGEIKNKQPNGLGVAAYSNGNVLRYAGNFVNGVYNGKGTMLFSTGAFLTGEWKNGKLNGKGADLNQTGSLYIGNFNDGKKDGKGNYFYPDNAILQGEWKVDRFNGRSIFIPGNAGSLNDNMYVADKKNGPGYQYELDTKKLFQGTWKDGNWEAAATGNYTSFLSHKDFYSEKTAAQILIGPLNNSTKGLYDTAFFYDLKNKKRYFGVFEDGSFRKGVIVRDDSSRFVGAIDKNGANGYASYYKSGSFYDEGKYSNDYMEGPGCLSIDLKAKTIYFGEMSNKGLFTGKAWFVNNRNELFNGEYIKGIFTGSGYLVSAQGYCVKANWKEGFPTIVTSFTDDKGMPVSLSPKSIAEAITTVASQVNDDLNLLMGATSSDLLDYTIKNKSILTFPMGLKKDEIQEDEEFEVNYVAPYLETTDFSKAKDKYLELCKQLDVLKISLDKTGSPFELEGAPKDPDAAKTTNSCSFLFPYNKAPRAGYAASVVIVKGEDKVYTVQLVLGDKESSLLTGDK